VNTSALAPVLDVDRLSVRGAGANGPVILPFTKISDNVFVAPESARLTDAQYASYKAGNLYVNVHSAKNPGGEIRAQIVGR